MVGVWGVSENLVNGKCRDWLTTQELPANMSERMKPRGEKKKRES